MRRRSRSQPLWHTRARPFAHVSVIVMSGPMARLARPFAYVSATSYAGAVTRSSPRHLGHLRWWVGADGLFVDLHPPTGTATRYEVALFEDRRRRQFVSPRDAVYVDFHDVQIWHGGRETGTYGRSQVTVEIIRSSPLSGRGHRQ